jgi:hypothetical protein
MDKKSETHENPWDDLEKLKGNALKAAHEKLIQEGFSLRCSGDESSMGEFILLIAQLTIEKTEFRLIDNASSIEVWAKPSDSKKATKEVRDGISPLLDSKTHRR